MGTSSSISNEPHDETLPFSAMEEKLIIKYFKPRLLELVQNNDPCSKFSYDRSKMKNNNIIAQYLPHLRYYESIDYNKVLHCIDDNNDIYEIYPPNGKCAIYGQFYFNNRYDPINRRFRIIHRYDEEKKCLRYYIGLSLDLNL